MGKFKGGLVAYILKSIAKAMLSTGGLVIITHLTGHAGSWVYVNPRYLGLKDHYKLVTKLAVRSTRYQMKLAYVNSYDQRKAHAKRLKVQERKHSRQQYNGLFKEVCVGKGACPKFGEKTCKRTPGCLWRGSWHGDVAMVGDGMGGALNYGDQP